MSTGFPLLPTSQYQNTCHYMESYITTKFDFMNYAFANLLAAWL